MLLGLVSKGVWAEEIAPFRITGTDGYATLRYLQDDYGAATGDGMSSNSQQQQRDLRMDVFLNGHGYVYHPNFLSLDVGGGPILQRQQYAANAGSAAYTGKQYNLSVKASFLKDKPYRGSLFYDHLNPTQSVAPGQVITQENQRYGGDFSLLAPISPVPLNFSFSHGESNGKGADRVVNDNTDQYSLRLSRSFGALGNTQLQYQSQRQSSLSGSSLLPIQASRNNSDGLNVDSRFQLRSNLDLTQLFSMNRRTYVSGALHVPAQSDMRVMLDLRHRYSTDLQEYLTVNSSRNHQGSVDSTQQSVGGGLYFRPDPGLELTAGARGETSQTDSFTSQTRSANGSVNYQQALWDGVLQTGYSAAIDWRSQQASSASTPIFGEAVTLTGTQYAALSRNNVTKDSITVTNNTRTQVFAENVDYLLTVVGAETRIQRLLGGGILDGEQVLVDYRYDVGGTYAYRQVDQNVSVGWSYGRYLSFSLRHLDSKPVLVSGQTIFPFNVVSSTVWGMRAEIPLATLGWSVGGGYEREERQETLAPFQRSSSDAYLQNDDPLPAFANVRLGMRRTRVDYGNASQNVNMTGYDFRYGARPGFGWDVSATANVERDDGGMLPRRRMDAALNAQWRERKLSMTFSFMRTRETQGEVQRTRSLLQWQLRRDF